MVMTRRQVVLAGAAAGLIGPSVPVAHALTFEEETVERARLTVLELVGDPDFQILPSTLQRARGVLIFPELYRGGFLVGGEGGIGVFLVRRTDGSWGYPAFYLMAGASFGLQIGGQISELILVVMTDRGIEAILSRYATLGADANVAVIAVGAGVEARTGMDLDADMYAFARNQGLFAGLTLEGQVITPQESRNAAYYGSGASERDILAGRRVNMAADPLRAALP
ncbi:MAG: lipid-binding SYLF domain-containing protein [Rhodospirillaceae bacterium]|nr:lipid-binding SYLF domain-containing protein [Rhodospirillaceae bacterium]